MGIYDELISPQLYCNREILCIVERFNGVVECGNGRRLLHRSMGIIGRKKCSNDSISQTCYQIFV